MDDNYDFSAKPESRLSDSLGEPPRQTSVPAKTENEIHTDVPAVEPATGGTLSHRGARDSLPDSDQPGSFRRLQGEVSHPQLSRERISPSAMKK